MFAAEKIKAIVEAALPECTALVWDNRNDGEHFSAEVVSSAFVGVMRVQQHRLVYQGFGRPHEARHPCIGTENLHARTMAP